MKDLVRLTSGLGFLSLVAAGLGTVAALIVAASAGPGAFGRQASLLGMATLGALVLDAGLSVTIQRRRAKNHDDAKGSAFALSRRYLSGGGVALVALSLIPVLGAPVGLAAAYSGLIATSLATGAILRGSNRFLLAATLGVADKATALAVVAVFGTRFPETSLLLAYTVGAAVQVVSAVAITPPHMTWEAYSLRQYLDDMRQGRIFFSTSVLYESQRLDVPLVQLFAGATSAGLFAAPARITALLGLPANILSSVMLTRLSSGLPDAARETRRVALGLIAGHLAIALALVFVAHPLTTTVLGESYSEAAPLLVIYGFAMLPAALNQLCASVLTSQHREAVAARGALVCMPLSLILVALGSHFYGAIGATAGFTIGQATLTALLLPAAARGLRSITSQ